MKQNTMTIETWAGMFRDYPVERLENGLTETLKRIKLLLKLLIRALVFPTKIYPTFSTVFINQILPELKPTNPVMVLVFPLLKKLFNFIMVKSVLRAKITVELLLLSVYLYSVNLQNLKLNSRL